MKFNNLQRQYEAIKETIWCNLNEVFNSCNFISGEKGRELEEKLEIMTGSKNVITCSSGTSALHLAYMAEGIGQGAAVFCPDMTFVASIEPAVMLGATPVFCDVDKKTFNLCTESLQRQIDHVRSESKLIPKAVVAVDFLGNPANYDKIRKITEKNDLVLIEDAAQAIGATWQGKCCGALGDISITSFFPSKPLGGYGDGGAVFVDDDEKADLIRSLKVHGKGMSKYDNIQVGVNSRLDEVQAAILLAKLEILPHEIEMRQLKAAYYTQKLKDYVDYQHVEVGNQSIYEQYVIKFDSPKKKEGLERNFEDVSKLFDHTAHGGSNYLNGHCLVSLMLCIPVWNKDRDKISYLAVPLGYRMWRKEKSKLELAAEMVDYVMPCFDSKQVIMLCDSWYAKESLLKLVDRYPNVLVYKQNN